MKKFVAILFTLLFVNAAKAQEYWKQKDTIYINKNTGCAAKSNITQFETWQLNYNKLKKLAHKAMPSAQKTDNVIIDLPFENGAIKRFRIFDAQTMSAELAKQFPEIKSYVGECIDDKLITARIDFNDLGLHVLISNSQGLQWLVEPYCQSSKKFYVSYNKANYKSDREPFNEERRR